eukprot:UC1_evm1s95
MRDRLKDLQAKAISAAADEPAVATGDVALELGDGEGGEETGADAAGPQEASLDELLTPFFTKVNRVRDTLTKIEEDINFVSNKHSEILVQYSAAKAKEINDELHARMDKISLSANRVRKELKIMQRENEVAAAEGTDADGNMTAEVRTRKGLHLTLSKKFVAVMKHYNEVQAENKQKYKEHVRRKCRIENDQIDDAQIDEMVEKGTVDSLFTGKKRTEAAEALHEIQDRHQDIKQLEKSLLELHEMFVDMAMLIEQQGEMINRIEFTTEKSAIYVEKARENTRKAQKLQSAARQKKICCLIFLLVLIAIIVLIAVLSRA